MTVVHQILWVIGWPFRIVLLGLIRGYQRFVSPLFRPSCRYHPVCSAYAYRAIARHGAFKGTVLTTWRLLRCNPWSKGGVDPVPSRGHWLPDIYPDGTARSPKAVRGTAAGTGTSSASQGH